MHAYNIYYHFFSVKLFTFPALFPCAIYYHPLSYHIKIWVYVTMIDYFDFQKTQNQSYCSAIATV